MKPYESYKKTQYDWLSSIPEHWQRNTIRSITKVSDTRNGSRNDLELLSVYREYGVIKKSSRNDNHNVESTNLSNYKFVDIGYLVMNKMKMWQGSLGVSEYKGIVSPAYIICKITKELNNKYLHFLLRSSVFKAYYNRISYGVRVGQWDMRYDDFKQLEFFLPSRTEQDQIVRFLDWQLSKINKLIKAKKKQIVLLNEQKQAIINKAVTKGLDDTVSMKDSWVDWIGEIPQDWKVNRLKRFCKVNASIAHLTLKCSDNDQLVFLPMENVSVKGDIDCAIKRPYKDIKSGYSSFAKNDVVVAKITPCFENGKGACLDKLETEIGYGTTEFITLRCYQNMIPRYLYYVTQMSWFRLFGAEIMTGSAGQKRVPSDFISNFTLGIPNIDVQKSIVYFLENYIAATDVTISKIQVELTLITEYRTSLISSVVTGKIDVRDVIVPDFEIEDEVLEDEDEISVDGVEASEVDE